MALSRDTRIWLSITGGVIGIFAIGGLILWASASQRADPSASASASATASAPHSLSASPDGSASPDPSISPLPQPTASASSPNDPGDGVATDPPVPAPTASANGKVQAELVLTRWGYSDGAISAAGFVQGVVDESGTCTITAVQGEAAATATGAAHRSASSTDCADGLAIPRDQLTPGDWLVSISYESSRYKGTSETKVVTVP